MQIIVQENCENAPRKAILRDLIIAIVEKDTQTILEYVDEKMVHVEIGKAEVHGVEGFLERIEQVIAGRVLELEILHIITHGKFASVNGIVETIDRQEFHFSIFFEFKGAARTAKVKEMTSYIIFV